MRELAHPAARIAAAAAALSALVALAVKATGSAAAARAELVLSFPGPARRPGQAVEIAAHNSRYLAALLLACLAVSAAPRLRHALDTVLGALLCLNAGLIGFAWGAYGTQLLRALALHGTAELAAFALGGSAYLRARTGQLTHRRLACAAAAASLILAAAAALETYVSLEQGGTG